MRVLKAQRKRMMRLISALSLAACFFTGCAAHDLHRVRCEWPSEPGVLLDLKNPAHERHLHDDAQTAEGLAASYADSKQGLEKFGQHRQSTERCEATLFNAIARVHQIAPEQVRIALRRQNDTPF
jgi:hypothetical protein